MTTQPRKTASEWAKEVCDSKKSGTVFLGDAAHINDVQEALESYLLQESGELVKCLESVDKELFGWSNYDKLRSDIRQSLNTFRSRHDG